MLAAVLFAIACILFIVCVWQSKSLHDAALALVALGLAVMAGLGDLL